MKRTLMLAYGANTCPVSMAMRCPAAKPLGAVTLRDYALVFRGVADIVPLKGSTLHGVLWSITPECERELDLFEQYPHLYIKRRVQVRDRLDTRFTAMAYVMARHADPKRLEVCPPGSFYYETLCSGYRYFGLPVSQIDNAADAADRASWYFDEFSRIDG